MSINDKFVAIATKQCPVCLEKHSYNTEVLIHKNLREIKPEDTFTGLGMCEEHDHLRATGYVALIETSTTPANGDTLKIEDSVYTGNVAHIRRSVLPEIFNITISEDTAFVFVEVGVIDMLKDIPTEEN